jgi:hypothetical protein
MFKWVCLGVAVLAVLVLGWMINDLRVELKQAVHTINQNLPEMVEKTRKGTDTVVEHLPEIVVKTRKSADTLAELSEDVRQIKDLAGVVSQTREKTLVAYMDNVLDYIENSGGQIGPKKLIGKGLKDPVSAREWVVGARKKALYLVLTCRSRQEFLEELCDKVFGTRWYIQIGEEEATPLIDWLRANHPESKSPQPTS